MSFNEHDNMNPVALGNSQQCFNLIVSVRILPPVSLFLWNVYVHVCVCMWYRGRVEGENSSVMHLYLKKTVCKKALTQNLLETCSAFYCRGILRRYCGFGSRPLK